MSFKDLKRNRTKISKLVEAAENSSGSKKSYGDDRLWKPTADKAGNGYAVIRFLPSKSPDSLPWVQYWDHAFKGPTGLWYFEKSLTTIGKDDPVSEMNSTLWNSGNEKDKELARKYKRRLHYVSNILVLNDPANPDNNGKVFLYQYGKKIFDKIMDAMEPTFEDEEPINPFDFWEGANFKLKFMQVDGFRNYDKSEFEKPSALSESDEYLEEIYNQMHDLSEFIDPKTFKSYDELKAKLNKVLCLEDKPAVSVVEDIQEQPQKMKEQEPELSSETILSSDDEDDEDIEDYFAKLAEGD